MKRVFRFFSYLTTVLLLLLHSCIGEDNTDCPPQNVRVYFAYRTTYSPGLLDPAEVNRFNLFVFDGNGKFIGEWIDESPSLSPLYYMELPLDYGTYSFVCWGGFTQDCYQANPEAFIPGQTDINECMLRLKRTESNIIDHHPNHLFYARLDIAEVIRPGMNFTLDLKQITNTINVTTEGIDFPEHTYSLYIEDDNGDHTFDNSCASLTKLRYISPCSKDKDGQPYGSLRVLSLNEQRPTPELVLTNEITGKIFFSANLVELILKLREQGITVDLEDIHTYDIHLKFMKVSDTDMDVQVSINGWIINETLNEI
ncbi:FimB/Mfa2 family fimbrial subunit [Dysgonomonas termitidis]|uniref:FimB/Mfa2 family fimbrial subunit n=1 Tax=Dysgonomonas termitidis TaxID=1516126 RepID=A0ABV9KTI8_9BACT